MNGEKKCVFAWNDTEVGVDEYEVLQEAPFLQWESTGLGWAPPQSIKAGLEEGDHANYICRFDSQ